MNRSDPARAPGVAAAGARLDAWRQQLGDLALACAGSGPADEAACLRELHRLIAAAPVSALVRGLALPDAARLAALLAAAAPHSTALEMIAPESGYLLSRGAGGPCLASVILPGAAEETSASGETLALAIVGALALALVEADLAQPERRTAPRPARLN